MTKAQRTLLEDLDGMGGSFSAFSPWEHRVLRALRDQGLATREGERWSLTERGRRAAAGLKTFRSHTTSN